MNNNHHHDNNYSGQKNLRQMYRMVARKITFRGYNDNPQHANLIAVSSCVGIITILVMMVAGLAIISGCQNFSDNIVKPEVKVPAQTSQKIQQLKWNELRKDDNQESAAKAQRNNAEINPPEELELTLEQCRATALEHNLNIAVQLDSPLINSESLRQAKAGFEPVAFSNFNFSKNDTPSGTPISKTLDSSQTSSLSGDVGVTIPLSTGGQLTFDLPVNEFTNEFPDPSNPSRSKDQSMYTSDFSATLNIPLLRSAGLRNNMHQIRIAGYAQQKSMLQTKLSIINILSQADTAYWNLYAARKILQVRQQEYDLAVEQKNTAQRRLNAGSGKEIDVIRSESAMAQRLNNIILAENTVKQNERELKRILNRKDIPLDSKTRLKCSVKPTLIDYQLDSRKVLEYALQNRMELLNYELDLASMKSGIEYYRNQMLPSLNATYRSNVNGVGPTLHDSYKVLQHKDYIDHYLGLQLQVPLGNKLRSSQYRQAKLQYHQTIVRKKVQQQIIQQEVLDSLDRMQANWNSILASRKSTLLARRTLEAAQRLFGQGMQTSLEVLDAQTAYANALATEINSMVAYYQAQIQLAQAAGCLLGAAEVNWELPEKENM